jgi:hypothetical protein
MRHSLARAGLAAALLLTVPGIAAAASAVSCQFELVPLPDGASTQVLVSCRNLAGSDCSEADPAESLSLPEQLGAGRVAPLRTVDEVPMRELPSPATPMAPQWGNY